MLSPDNHCGRCARYLLAPDDRMTDRGYGRCRLAPVWQYRAPGAACAFVPTRFQARP